MSERRKWAEHILVKPGWEFRSMEISHDAVYGGSVVRVIFEEKKDFRTHEESDKKEGE